MVNTGHRRSVYRALLWICLGVFSGVSAPAFGAEGKFFLLHQDKPLTARQTVTTGKRNAYAATAEEAARNPYNATQAAPHSFPSVAALNKDRTFLPLAKAKRLSVVGRVAAPSRAVAKYDARFETASRGPQAAPEGAIADTASVADVRIVSPSRRAPVMAVEVNELDDDIDTTEGVKLEDEPNPIEPLIVEPAGKVKHLWPVDLAAEQRISSPYGWRKHPVTGKRSFHTGMDIAAPAGTRVLASADGEVAETGTHHNLGNYIRIRHADGTMSVYGHLSKITVPQGKAVKSGQVIGAVGATGRSTGPHLHFTLKEDGQLVDPSKRLKKPSASKVFAAKEK